MILREIGGEKIYLDERSQSEFIGVCSGLIGFGTLAALIMVIAPLLYLWGVDRVIIVIVSIIGVGFAIYMFYAGTKEDLGYYDVWIPGEHRHIQKTGTNNDKTKVLAAANELETVLRERIHFGRSLSEWMKE